MDIFRARGGLAAGKIGNISDVAGRNQNGSVDAMEDEDERGMCEEEVCKTSTAKHLNMVYSSILLRYYGHGKRGAGAGGGLVRGVSDMIYTVVAGGG